MPDMTVIAQALGALKALKDIGEATIGLANAAAFRERQIEFQQRIIDAQSAISAMQVEHSTALERVRDLEKEITRLKAWETQKERYELKRYNPGVFLRALKPSEARGEPPHTICPKCYEHGKPSVIQRTGNMMTAREPTHFCPECRTEFSLHRTQQDGL
jgi:rubrerythrin